MTAHLEKLVLAIGAELQKRQLKIATAESCTGGGLGYWLTHVPGSSHWFDRGFITYSNAAKEELLSVPVKIIATFGAVSEQTARAMAEGVLQHSLADISVAITGIAGPEGGSPEKPVGTVWIAWGRRYFPTQAQVAIFSGTRQAVRDQAILAALMGLLKIIPLT